MLTGVHLVMLAREHVTDIPPSRTDWFPCTLRTVVILWSWWAASGAHMGSWQHACRKCWDTSNFDVPSFFTRVPVGEAVSVVCRRLLGSKTWLTGPPSPKTVSQSCWRCAWGQPTSALVGTSMSMQKGLKCSNGIPGFCQDGQPYMEFFKDVVLGTVPSRPRLWTRYVDDIFCTHRKVTMEELFDHLNRIQPTIKLWS